MPTGNKTQSSETAALGLTGSFTINGGSSAASVTVSSSTSLDDIRDQINAGTSTTGLTASVVSAGSGFQLEITGASSPLTFSNINGEALSGLGLASSPSGYLGTMSATFAGYATALTSDIATRASNAKSDDTTKSTTLTAIQSNLSSQSGVNTDEESAHLVELQNAYAASAKVISTFQTMFSALLNAVQA
jgi:flagellar hook-associated protein 1 FlgK